MKEIITIIRRHKVPETKDALKKAGFIALTIQSVEGRGIQKGIGGWIAEVDPGLSEYVTEKEYSDPGIKFIPKRMLTIVVDDNDVHKVVSTIIDVNKTGNIGDGKVFVCPVEEVFRVRTGSKGMSILQKKGVDG